MAKVHVPSTLRLLTNGAANVDADGITLAEVFDALERQFPGIKERLFIREELRRFFRIAVNDEVVLGGAWSAFKVSSSDTVVIVPAIAGG